MPLNNQNSWSVKVKDSYRQKEDLREGEETREDWDRGPEAKINLKLYFPVQDQSQKAPLQQKTLPIQQIPRFQLKMKKPISINRQPSWITPIQKKSLTLKSEEETLQSDLQETPKIQ